MSCSQLAYYKLLPILNVIPRNVCQDHQRAMVIYCHSSEPMYYKLVPNTKYHTKKCISEITKEQC